MKNRSIKEIELIIDKLNLLNNKIWKLIFNFPYKKLFLLVLITILTYVFFRNSNVQAAVQSLSNFKYLGIFIAGLFFTFGFTTPIAAGFFIVLNPENIIFSSLIAGLGAVFGDLVIFSFIRFSFIDEFKKLEKTRILTILKNKINNYLSEKIKIYFLYSLAGLIIASPLPDEAGVIMLAGLTTIKPKLLAVISFIFNTLGIFLLLWL